MRCRVSKALSSDRGTIVLEGTGTARWYIRTDRLRPFHAAAALTAVSSGGAVIVLITRNHTGGYGIQVEKPERLTH